MSRYRDPQLQVCKNTYTCAIHIRTCANLANLMVISPSNSRGTNKKRLTRNPAHPRRWADVVKCWVSVVDGEPTLKQHWLNVSCYFLNIYRISIFMRGVKVHVFNWTRRCPVISDLDYFGLVISDVNLWFRTVISGGVRWNRTVISDGVRWIRTPRWIRTVISDGVRWIRTPNIVVFHITVLVLISQISDGDFGQWFWTEISNGVISDGIMHKET